ncbi:MAG: NAD-dependent protein deacylase, partial [Anaerolineae bacterium]|nr:NAD-dependent protein deacylase [Anaerolineae bacterium]
ALVRPDVVWFGEQLDHAVIQRAFVESEACDVMLIVGTSGVVHPAASLPYQAWNRRARIIEVNPVPSELTDLAHVFLQGPAGQVLPNVLTAVDDQRTVR